MDSRRPIAGSRRPEMANSSRPCDSLWPAFERTPRPALFVLAIAVGTSLAARQVPAPSAFVSAGRWAHTKASQKSVGGQIYGQPARARNTRGQQFNPARQVVGGRVDAQLAETLTMTTHGRLLLALKRPPPLAAANLARSLRPSLAICHPLIRSASSHGPHRSTRSTQRV